MAAKEISTVEVALNELGAVLSAVRRCGPRLPQRRLMATVARRQR